MLTIEAPQGNLTNAYQFNLNEQFHLVSGPQIPTRRFEESPILDLAILKEGPFGEIYFTHGL